MTITFKTFALVAVAATGLAACDNMQTTGVQASNGLTLASAQMQYPDLGPAEFAVLDIDGNQILDAQEVSRIATTDGDVNSAQDLNIDNDDN